MVQFMLCKYLALILVLQQVFPVLLHVTHEWFFEIFSEFTVLLIYNVETRE